MRQVGNAHSLQEQALCTDVMFDFCVKQFGTENLVIYKWLGSATREPGDFRSKYFELLTHLQGGCFEWSILYNQLQLWGRSSIQRVVCRVLALPKSLHQPITILDLILVGVDYRVH